MQITKSNRKSMAHYIFCMYRITMTAMRAVYVGVFISTSKVRCILPRRSSDHIRKIHLGVHDRKLHSDINLAEKRSLCTQEFPAKSMFVTYSRTTRLSAFGT